MHNGRALRIEGDEQLHDVARLRRVQVAGGFVGQEQRRSGDDGSRHTHQLLLSARELSRIQVFLAHDPELVQRVRNHRRAAVARNVAIRQRHIQVLRHREVVQQVVLLEDEPDVPPVEREAVLVRQGVYRRAAIEVLANPRAVEHANYRKQGRLARPRWTHDGDELARGDVERHPAQHVRLAGGRVEVLLDATHGHQGARERGVLGDGRRLGRPERRHPAAHACASAISSTTRPSKMWIERSAWRA